MDNTQKLLSDIDKLKKHYRAEHNNEYDGEAVCKKINEPSEENLARLAAMQSLLEGETEGTECLTDDDWHELCELVNEDAAELPLDALNNMMAIFVDKQSL